MASSKSLVCKFTSASVVVGHINAMLWNGVIRMPRLSMKRCMNSSRRSLLAATDWPPFLGAGFVNRYSARAPSWLIDHGMLYFYKRAIVYLVNFVQSLIILSKAYSVRTFSKVVRMAAKDRAFPARVPPIPPTSTKSTFLAVIIFYASS